MALEDLQPRLQQALQFGIGRRRNQLGLQRRADVREERQLRSGDPMVIQVSRWDRLKDPLGVIEGFARGVATGTDAHLVMAGPTTEGVSDDPEE